MTISVGIQGASGYVGAELVRILSGHPEVNIAFVTSERHAGHSMAKIFPHLAMREDLICRPLNDFSGLEACQLVFCALPHVTSMGVVPEMLERGLRVVDLSADFRLKSADVYQEWYKEPHKAPEWLQEAVYGLPELYRKEIGPARLVANPGCYPTSAILALAPLISVPGLVDESTLVIDSKSGVSGAGRAAAEGKLFAELTEGFRAYNTGFHRHTPEIEQVLGELAGRPIVVRFAPHLIPQSRGILSTCHVRMVTMEEESVVRERYERYYQGEPFVRILGQGEYPATNHVRASNFAHLAVVVDKRCGWLTILSTIDNLVKGAAGQAVQNMNIMFGFEETMGLWQLPVFP